MNKKYYNSILNNLGKNHGHFSKIKNISLIIYAKICNFFLRNKKFDKYLKEIIKEAFETFFIGSVRSLQILFITFIGGAINTLVEGKKKIEDKTKKFCNCVNKNIKDENFLHFTLSSRNTELANIEEYNKSVLISNISSLFLTIKDLNLETGLNKDGKKISSYMRNNILHEKGLYVEDKIVYRNNEKLINILICILEIIREEKEIINKKHGWYLGCSFNIANKYIDLCKL